MVAADSGSRSFTVSVCFVLVLVFRFLIFSLSGFPGSLVTYLPFRLLHSVILSSVVVLSGIVRLSSALFFMLYYFFIL